MNGVVVRRILALTTCLVVFPLASAWAEGTEAEEAEAEEAENDANGTRSIRVAAIQFDAVPEEVDANLDKMEQLARKASKLGARWIVFHEGTVCDYTNNLNRFAEYVPLGKSTQRMSEVAKSIDGYISFGLSEKDDQEHFYITQVFVGPEGFFYRYRKTWLCNSSSDRGFRNEHARYDPGRGPELFTLDGVQATCFICSDGSAPRCIQRAGQLRPEVVFFPVNICAKERAWFRDQASAHAIAIGAPVILANRVGASWVHQGGVGGAAIFSASGDMLAAANCEGKEEIILADLQLPRSDQVDLAPK